MLSPETQFLIDFNCHLVPAALGVPVSSAAGASMFGISEAEFLAHLEQVDRQVWATAARLLAEESVATALDRWQVPGAGTVMFVGDSITTYRLGYARLIAAMAGLRHPQLFFHNVAQSGYTSTHGLEATFTQFLAHQPDWVFIKFGANDCKQLGGPQARTLVSLEEYRANMAAIVFAFKHFSQAQIVLISPSPVVEPVVNSYPAFLPMRMTWDNQNLRACADVVRELAARHVLPFIDLFSALGSSPDPVHYLPDGLHPGPAGHEIIARHVLQTLDGSP